MTMNSDAAPQGDQAPAPKKRGHKGTFFVSCIIVTILYTAIEGQPPGLAHGAILTIPVLILTATLDMALDAIQKRKRNQKA